MYRYKLLRNGEQIHSSNNRMFCTSWQLSDHRNRSYQQQNDDEYEIVDGLEDDSFEPKRQALN